MRIKMPQIKKPKIKMSKEKIVMNITIGIACFALMLVMFMQFKVVNQTDITSIETMREEDLRTELADWREKYNELTDRYNDVMTKITEYQTEKENDEKTAQLLQKDLEQLSLALGTTNVKGEGVTIILTDNGGNSLADDEDVIISKITNTGKLDVSEINQSVGRMLEESIVEDELINLGELTKGNSLKLLSDAMLDKFKAMKNKNIAAEILSRAIKTNIKDIGKINLTIQEKFSEKFNKIVKMYNERTDMADIEKIIEEMINLKKEIENEIANGNEYNLSPEEKAFFDALGADHEIKELMKDEILVQIAKELVELINENLTLDAFKRED